LVSKREWLEQSQSTANRISMDRSHAKIVAAYLVGLGTGTNNAEYKKAQHDKSNAKRARNDENN
jgi:hypothetical protein